MREDSTASLRGSAKHDEACVRSIHPHLQIHGAKNSKGSQANLFDFADSVRKADSTESLRAQRSNPRQINPKKAEVESAKDTLIVDCHEAKASRNDAVAKRNDKLTIVKKIPISIALATALASPLVAQWSGNNVTCNGGNCTINGNSSTGITVTRGNHNGSNLVIEGGKSVSASGGTASVDMEPGATNLI